MEPTFLSESTLERIVRSVERVKERLSKAVQTLEATGVEYAIVGGNAVASWVSRSDEGAVRNTPDVDILVRRADLDDIKAALTAVGFEYVETSGVHHFRDGSKSKLSRGVRLVFAGEKVQDTDIVPAPDLWESETTATMRVVSLEGLVRMKLVAWRLKDQVHLQDMIGVGLIDHTWPAKYPTELAARLQHILDTPDG